MEGSLKQTIDRSRVQPGLNVPFRQTNPRAGKSICRYHNKVQLRKQNEITNRGVALLENSEVTHSEDSELKRPTK
jgi:hypothetical protein